jgi:hypothetical protein
MVAGFSSVGFDPEELQYEEEQGFHLSSIVAGISIFVNKLVKICLCRAMKGFLTQYDKIAIFLAWGTLGFQAYMPRFRPI